MEKFVPLTFLKDTASTVEFCQECGEPVFVTRNGSPEMVIMDSEFFNEYLRYHKKAGRLDIRREFTVVPKTITIRELKNTGEISELCRQTSEPISITRNGYGVLVLISIAGYEKRHSDLWKNDD